MSCNCKSYLNDEKAPATKEDGIMSQITKPATLIGATVGFGAAYFILNRKTGKK